MPIVTTTPGVYIEEDATPAISVAAGATAVPLFVGDFSPTDSANEGKIVRISSWLDFTTKFKLQSSINVEITSTPPASSKKALNDEEENNEGKNRKKSKSSPLLAEDNNTYTYEVKEINKTAITPWRALQLYFQNGGGACYICALAASSDQNSDMSVITSLIAETPEITLVVSAQAATDYRTSLYTALASTVASGSTAGVFLLADSEDGETVAGISESPHVAAYYPPLYVALSTLSDEEITISGYRDQTIVDESVTTLPALKAHNATLAQQVTEALKTSFATGISAPTSVAMAGVWCANDRTRGVWKAPANIVLNGVSGVETLVTDDSQGTMNTKGINVIRYFSDRGYVVWGARTLENSDNWRYIPVRRLFDAAERDIQRALRPMVFEPNSQPTWQRVYTAIDNYLHSLWQQGALAGSKPAEAWFVQVGKNVTMTEDDINQGKMIVKVGLAAVRPAEFIVLQFTQNMSA